MKKIIALSLTDVKIITRDQMLLLVICVPFIPAFLLRVGMPILHDLLLPYFEVSDHYGFIMSFLFILAPQMFGWVIGFILLDDRDEHILEFISVTPLTKSGYLVYRVFFPVVISFPLSLLVLMLAGLTELNFLRITPIALMASLEAPMMALFLAAFANNKVEGLVLGKLAGLYYIGPVIGYFIHSNWQLLGGIFPPYWITKAFIASYETTHGYWFYVIGGLIVHSLFIYLLLKKFNNRIT